MSAGYQALPGGYEIARLRVGVSLRSPDGREVYFRLGDDADAILDTVDALNELDSLDELKLSTVATIAFCEYFQ